MARSNLKDYVVLPARGIVSDNLATASLVNIAKRQSVRDVFDSMKNLKGLARFALNEGTSAVRYALEHGESKDYSLEVLHSFMDDGPKLVRMAPEAERLLRAEGLRVVPVTHYQLAVTAAPITVSAIDPAKLVNATDFLRHLYRGTATGPLGDGVTIGVLDSGVDGDHPRLKSVGGGRGLVRDESDLDWGPCGGKEGVHGTHVAGIICAAGDPAAGPVGVAPRAKVRSYRIFSKSNVKAGAQNYAIINAIRAAIEDGCDIINLSISGRGAKDDGVRDAINYAWDNGSLCLAAAGNDGRKPVSYPAAFPNCVAVSALGKDDLIPAGEKDRSFIADPRSQSDPTIFLASFSNLGPQIDFAGPGVWIVSTLPGGSMGAMSGTSMATPAVTGIAAVALSQNPTILGAKRDALRAEAIYKLLVSRAKPYRLGSFDYEGYGIPQA
jgi:subtilisin family serine protease